MGLLLLLVAKLVKYPVNHRAKIFQPRSFFRARGGARENFFAAPFFLLAQTGDICYGIFYRLHFESSAGRFCAAEMSIECTPADRRKIQEAIEVAIAARGEEDRESTNTRARQTAAGFSVLATASAPIIVDIRFLAVPSAAAMTHAGKKARATAALFRRPLPPVEFFRAAWCYIRR